MKYIVAAADSTTEKSIYSEFKGHCVKEKSKNAAKSRRERENMEYLDLVALLPVPDEVKEQLDKTSIIRLTTSYLRLRELYPYGMRQVLGSPRKLEDSEDESEMLEAIDGFIFALSPDGLILYISENVNTHLGMTAVDMMGHSIYDYVHSEDHGEMKEMLSVKSEEQELTRNFSVRMKCVLPKRNSGLASSGYKVIHCAGHLKIKPNSPSIAADIECYESLGLIAIGNPLLPNDIPEIKMNRNMFMFRASMDLKIIFLDSMVFDLAGYEPKELIESSYYKCIHPLDLRDFQKAHQELIQKGQLRTKYYRFGCKDGRYILMQSFAAVVTNSRTSQPRCIVCVNYVVSGKPEEAPETEIAG